MQKQTGNFRNLQIKPSSSYLLDKWQCMPVLLYVCNEQEEDWKRTSHWSVQVSATKWPHGDSSLRLYKKSSYHSKGCLFTSLDISNTRIKIEAPEWFSENKMKGESPRGNPEFAGEAKWSASWWTPRSRAGSFTGSKSLRRGQLDLAPGWAEGYENQMTTMIMIRIRLHSGLQMLWETLSLAKQQTRLTPERQRDCFTQNTIRDLSPRNTIERFLMLVALQPAQSSGTGSTQMLLGDKHHEGLLCTASVLCTQLQHCSIPGALWAPNINTHKNS